ncbi:hypothetical protein M885DRAFT_580612 [Pelagophyceae sp. CCMP2097]|nr:hypothetical protein M885DRAFT_580612 [Pelagophyceae sp. CCMP2097]
MMDERAIAADVPAREACTPCKVAPCAARLPQAEPPGAAASESDAFAGGAASASESDQAVAGGTSPAAERAAADRAATAHHQWLCGMLGRVRANDADAIFLLGMEYQGRPESAAGDAPARRLRRDVGRCQDLVRRAAALGHARAMTEVAAWHDDGSLADRDCMAALRGYRAAAAAGCGVAMHALALKALAGDSHCGVANDAKEAVRLLELAAARGVTPAQARLGACHQEGLGVEAPDLDRALHLYKTAARGGDAVAQKWAQDLEALLDGAGAVGSEPLLLLRPQRRPQGDAPPPNAPASAADDDEAREPRRKAARRPSGIAGVAGCVQS